MELSGWVKIVDENGLYVEARNLGPHPVAVKTGRVEAITEPPSVDHVYDGESWVLGVSPVLTPADTPLSMRQLRLGLLLIGGFPVTFIQDAINAIPDATQRGVAQIWYEETSVVEWGHPMTQQLIAVGGLTTEQAAAMWMQAKDLAA